MVANATGPGSAALGASSVSGGLLYSGCYFKNNGVALYQNPGPSRQQGLLIEAATGSIPGDPQYGIWTPSGGGNGYLGITIRGQYAQFGVHVTGGEPTISPSFWAGVGSVNDTGGGANNWELPSTADSMDIMGCNVADVWTMANIPAKTYTIATATWSGGVASLTVASGSGDLPFGQSISVTVTGMTPAGYNGSFIALVTNINAFTYTVANPGGSGTVMGTAFETTVSGTGTPNVFEGSCFNVSNADTATWGAAAVSTGSNHCKLRFTPAAWTVVGK